MSGNDCDDLGGTFEAQCWICPFCYDDHKFDGPCKQEDLKEEITKLRRAVSAAYTDVEQIDALREELEMASNGFKACYGAKKELKSILKEQISSVEKERDRYKQAGDFAIMTIEHAIALGYLGDGSTLGMAKDAVQKLRDAGCAHPADE